MRRFCDRTGAILSRSIEPGTEVVNPAGTRDSVPPMQASPARNVLLAAAFLLAVGAAAFGWFIDHGGLYSDDWATAAGYRFARAPHYWHAVVSESRVAGGRPVLAALHPLPYVFFGLHPALHIAFGVLLVVATCLCFYGVLRVLGLDSVDSAAIAVLALLFPWADSMELWPTAGINTVAVIFFFAGLIVALRGLDRPGAPGIVLHAAAAALYLLSVLTYEAVGAAAVLAGVFYLRRTHLRRAVAFWAVDVLAVLAGLIFSLVRTSSVRHVGGLHARLSDLRHMTRDAVALGESALLPFGRRTDVVHVLIGIAVVVVVAFLLWRAVRGVRDRSSRWLLFGAGAIVVIAAADFMFLGSTLHPLDTATSTRMNVFSRFGYALLVYAVIAAAAQWLAPTEHMAQVATLVLAGLLVVGYAVHLGRDESGWAKAGRLQGTVLSAIEAKLPHLDSGTTVVTFGAPALVHPGAVVFYANWDFPSAVQLKYHDRRLNAVPVYETVTVHCRPRRLVVHLPGSRGTAAPRYGRLVFLDVPTGRARRVSSAAVCGSALRQFYPGPYFAP